MPAGARQAAKIQAMTPSALNHATLREVLSELQMRI
jgi:hypothetical protein